MSAGNVLYVIGTQGAIGFSGRTDSNVDCFLQNGGWSYIPDTTTAVVLSSAVYDPFDNLIRAFGNLDGSNVQAQLRISDNVWTGDSPNIPQGFAGDAIVGCVKTIYYVLGSAAGNGPWTGQVFSYNPATQVYSSAFSVLPNSCKGDNMGVQIGNLIYWGGGFTDPNTLGAGTILSAWFKYNPLTDTHTALASMPAGRAGGTAVLLADNNTILVVGGYTSSSINGTSSVFAYDIARDAWATRGNFPYQIFYQASATHLGQTYVIGGGTTDFATRTSGVWRYNPNTDVWSPGPSLVSPCIAGYAVSAPAPGTSQSPAAWGTPFGAMRPRAL